MNLPLSKPEITPEDIAAVSATLKSGKLTQGPQTAALEEMVAAYVGAKFAVATNSHATAMHAALLTANKDAIDEVHVFGGTGAVGPAVYNQINSILQ